MLIGHHPVQQHLTLYNEHAYRLEGIVHMMHMSSPTQPTSSLCFGEAGFAPYNLKKRHTYVCVGRPNLEQPSRVNLSSGEEGREGEPPPPYQITSGKYKWAAQCNLSYMTNMTIVTSERGETL
jgi:hypothetical protein